MLADNWDRGSLYSYRAFSFPSEMPYEAIKQPVMFITGEKDGALTKGARKVCRVCVCACVCLNLSLFLHAERSVCLQKTLKQMYASVFAL